MSKIYDTVLMFDKITPVVLTFNEEANIARSLRQLDWAKRIVVVDSYSTDETEAIARSYPQVEFFQRRFDTHAKQWNYGLAQVETEWVLSLDADYVVTDELVSEIAALSENLLVDGYYIRFKYCVFGKPLQASILPPRQSLFRKVNATYVDDGHTQLLDLKGKTSQLSGFINHDDRKSLRRWLWAQDRYVFLEVQKLMTTPNHKLSWIDKLRKQKIIVPFIIPFYCLIWKKGILDGWHGWYYAFQRTLAEVLLAIRLIEAQMFPQREETPIEHTRP